jgi:hypothetical protein
MADASETDMSDRLGFHRAAYFRTLLPNNEAHIDPEAAQYHIPETVPETDTTAGFTP